MDPLRVLWLLEPLQQTDGEAEKVALHHGRNQLACCLLVILHTASTHMHSPTGEKREEEMR
jgi:hypothetical protein